mmetsp:Transcript_98441/g.195232  ORF Transcript_98441/g.195232 Transcript_98441/m.195232 type:complete len:283 (-) Transcript_98441:40-888(-)
MKQTFISTNLVQVAFLLLAEQPASARLVAPAPDVRNETSESTVRGPPSNRIIRKLAAAADVHNSGKAADIKPLLGKAGHGMLRIAAGMSNGSVPASSPVHLLAASGTAGKDGRAEGAEAHRKRMFYKEMTFGAPWGFHELERDLRCDDHVKGTETGHIKWGAKVIQAVRVVYSEAYGDAPTRAVLETYRKHLARKDLHICVLSECKVAVFFTTNEQKTAVGNFKNDNDHQPLLKCASLTSWEQAGVQDQRKLTPACDIDKMAANTYFNSTLEPATIALKDQC